MYLYSYTVWVTLDVGYYEVVTAKLVSLYWRKLAKNVVRKSKHAIVSSTSKKSKIGTQGHADIEN